MSQAASVVIEVDEEVASRPTPAINPAAAPYLQRRALENTAKAATTIARQQRAVELLKGLNSPPRHRGVAQGNTVEEVSLQPRTYPTVQTPAAAAPTQATKVRVRNAFALRFCLTCAVLTRNRRRVELVLELEDLGQPSRMTGRR